MRGCGLESELNRDLAASDDYVHDSEGRSEMNCQTRLMSMQA